MVDVVEHLLAVQAQDPRGARLAIRPRSVGLSAADVDAALADRTLLVTTLNRGTLHLVRAVDYWWLHALTTVSHATSNRTRLAQEGVSEAQADRGVEVVVRALTTEGPLVRAQLKEHLQRAGIPVEGQALVHVLHRTSLRGLTVRGPMIGQHQAHVLVTDWLGARPAGSPQGEAALAELGRRFLRGHGPADERDLVKWAGITVTRARQALRAVAAEAEERPGGLLALKGQPDTQRLPGPLLLGAFDPLLHGWVSRTPILGGPDHPAASVVTSNGLFRPFILVGGRAVGVWSMPDRRVQLSPFEPLEASVTKALASESSSVERYLDLVT